MIEIHYYTPEEIEQIRANLRRGNAEARAAILRRGSRADPRIVAQRQARLSAKSQPVDTP